VGLLEVFSTLRAALQLSKRTIASPQ
jgi:hypothetical protein